MIDSRSGFESMNPRPLTIEPHLVQIPMRSAVNISGAAARMQPTYIYILYCILYSVYIYMVVWKPLFSL